ncbi:hypothetical protein DTO195F2_6901 [Paecilomyces variotii]|nr:hypothetical protein DTO195F2_6901 [Paecilomyces variotii]
MMLWILHDSEQKRKWPLRSGEETLVDPATGDTIRIVDPLAASDPVHLYHLTLVGDSQQNLAAPSEGISKIKTLACPRAKPW